MVHSEMKLNPMDRCPKRDGHTTGRENRANGIVLNSVRMRTNGVGFEEEISEPCRHLRYELDSNALSDQ